MCECDNFSKGLTFKLVLSWDGPHVPSALFDLSRYAPWKVKRVRVERVAILNTATPSTEVTPVGKTLFVHSRELGRSVMGIFNNRTTPFLGMSTYVNGTYMSDGVGDTHHYDCGHILSNVDLFLTGYDGIPYALKSNETAVVVLNLYR